MYVPVSFYKEYETIYGEGSRLVAESHRNIYSNFFDGVDLPLEEVKGVSVVLDPYGIPVSGQISAYSPENGLRTVPYNIRNGVWIRTAWKEAV